MKKFDTIIEKLQNIDEAGNAVKELDSELRNIAGSIQTIGELFGDNTEFMDSVIGTKEWTQVLKTIASIQKSSLDEVAYEVKDDVAALNKTLKKLLK